MDCLARNQIKAPDTSVTFSARVINKTDVDFCNEELFLLSIGMKYSVHTKKKDWVTNHALEAETAISDSDHECNRWQVAKRLESPFDLNKQLRDHKDKSEMIISKTVKVKLDDNNNNNNNNNNNATIAQSDKGN